MSRPDAGDILDLYAHGFRTGMIDVSTSTPGLCDSEPQLADYPEPGGAPELRTAIARLYPGLSPENIVVTNGASEALAAAALAFVQPGTTVSLCQGAYPSFSRLASRFGARIVGDSRHATVALVNNPSVPDGRLHDLSQLACELDAAATRLICDEVYLDLRPGAAILPVARLSKTAVSIGDVSKPLGLGGLRIGWAASQDDAAIESLKRSVQVLSGGPSTVAMEMATTAVSQYGDRFEALQRAAMTNAPAVFAVLDSAGWSYSKPDAGWTFSARPPHPLQHSFTQRAADAGLFLASTSAFGMNDGSFRISLFASVEALRQVLGLAAGPVRERLVVLAKAPEFSKTRLARQAGPSLGFAVASALLEDTFAMVGAGARDTSIAFTPASARGAFHALAPSADLLEQPHGDLGLRISGALDSALCDGSRAVLIGTDTPHLTPTLLDDAFRSLAAADIVIGPATDGGFYLLGLSTAVFPPGLFDEVQWSTASVCKQVVGNAHRLGLRVAHLPALTDIDDLSSLRTVIDSERVPGAAPRTAAVLAASYEVER